MLRASPGKEQRSLSRRDSHSLRRDSLSLLRNVPGRRRTTGGAGRATSSVPSARRRERPSPIHTRGAPPLTGSTSWSDWVDFLERTDCWLLADALLAGAGSGETGTIYAILDNLSAHRAADVLLFSVSHPRWEFVFQPVYAAYLNLIEPWWKTLRSLALKGRRFETWEEIVQAVEAATVYWNAHRHPFVWGRRRRHQPRRKAGLAVMPTAA